MTKNRQEGHEKKERRNNTQKYEFYEKKILQVLQLQKKCCGLYIINLRHFA